MGSETIAACNTARINKGLPRFFSGEMSTWGYEITGPSQDRDWEALSYALETARQLKDLATEHKLKLGGVPLESFVAKISELGEDLPERLRNTLGNEPGEYIEIRGPLEEPFVALLDSQSVNTLGKEQTSAHRAVTQSMMARLANLMMVGYDVRRQSGAAAYDVAPQLFVGEGPGGYLVGLWAVNSSVHGAGA